MNFNDLSLDEKKSLHTEILSHATHLGGKNFLLQLIEDTKRVEDSPLVSKDKHFSFAKGFVTWNKVIYKETFDLLLTAIITQEREGDAFKGFKEKDQKRILNMFKTLSPVILTIKPKNIKDGEGFTLPIIEQEEGKDTRISLMFKILFFHNIEFAKKALAFKVMEA
jgi:hypothetical protein